MRAVLPRRLSECRCGSRARSARGPAHDPAGRSQAMRAIQNRTAQAGSHFSPERQQEVQRGRLRDCAAVARWFEATMQAHDIDCSYHRTGRLTGLWIEAHRDAWARRLDELNTLTEAEVRMISREQLGGDLYHGAVLIGRAGHLDPARLYGGLLAVAGCTGAAAHGRTKVERWCASRATSICGPKVESCARTRS